MKSVVLNGVNLTLGAVEISQRSSAATAQELYPVQCNHRSFFPDRGLIMLGGEDITDQQEHVRSKRIGHLFQDPLKGTAPHTTIEENMALAIFGRQPPEWPFQQDQRGVE